MAEAYTLLSAVLVCK